MIHPAFEARDLTGTVLLKNKDLMELWKWASNEGLVQAVRVDGANYAVVKDEDLAERLGAVKGLTAYRFDDAKGELV